jgi:hypothetical protein
MINRTLLILTSLFTIPTTVAVAYPVPLGTRQPLAIPAKFIEQYTFFEDSEAPSKLFVVPRVGTVDLRSSGQNVWPRFSFDTGIASTGYFYGYDYVRLGGTFRTDARPALYKELDELVRTWGLTLSYAPFWSSRPEILSLGTIRRPGDQLECQFEERLLQDGIKKISVPRCIVRDSGRELDIDLFQNFALLASDAGSVGNPIGWSARTLPGWEAPLRQKLEQGAGWDDFFILTITWDLTADGQSKTALETNAVNLLKSLKNWYEQKGLRGWSLSDIQRLAQSISACGEDCGLRRSVPADQAFIQAFASWLAEKFFVRMNQDNDALWIPKSFPLNESDYFDQFRSESLRISGPGASRAETRILIQCLLNPEDGSRRLRWDLDSPDCKEAIRR